MPVEEENQLIAELARHPAWTALRTVVKERMEKQFRIFAADLMAGRGVSEADREYARGFFAGAKYLLDKPKLTDAEIQRELAKRKEVEVSV